MIIDKDLRIAIRSAERAQPSSDWGTRRVGAKTAIEDFLKRKPEVAARLKKATIDLNKAEAKVKEASTVFKDFGINNDLDYIYSEDSFRRAGGKLPTSVRRWKFDAVMAELAAAEPKARKSILAKYNIVWD